ncbi:deoxycytidine kinase-like isoform X2 [Acipenser oxyrinchus oxyrinchus]|uniref:deoxyguanosine kinase n=1 Tax=Acipenser oxyrinchus oxyrinchus TaxID=40147 RepID=A0AAD8CPL3_ACIOX|nr:deoxycytidine kinase-like isoform X2 [Acipenser oxyrinchus oxyrinchus]
MSHTTLCTMTLAFRSLNSPCLIRAVRLFTVCANMSSRGSLLLLLLFQKRLSYRLNARPEVTASFSGQSRHFSGFSTLRTGPGSGMKQHEHLPVKRVCSSTKLGSRLTDTDQDSGSSRLKRVSIEGNIAVGKSTFVRLLKKVEKRWEVIPEPLSKWQNLQTCESREGVSGSQQSVSNLLQIMYQDPTRWSYTFQSFSCMSRLRAQLEAPPPSLLELERPLQIFERSVYSDRYVFAVNLFQMGCINETEWAIYQDWHSFLVQQFSKRIELEGIVYLRAHPQKCLERLGRRARQEEMSVDLQYLERLHSQHEDWLIEKTTPLHFDHLKSTPVLVLDVNEEFEQDQAVQERLVKQVKNFFNSLWLRD